MRLAGALITASLVLSGSARAADAPAPTPLPPPPTRPPPEGRFCVAAAVSYVAMRVYDVPVHWYDVPLGIGGCYDHGEIGLEWYGTASFGHGRTHAGRSASMGSFFGTRLVFRVAMVRVLVGARVVSMSFAPAPGLDTGDGLSGAEGMTELGLGLDLLRVFARDSDRVRATVTLDGGVQTWSLGGGLGYFIALGAHL